MKKIITEFIGTFFLVFTIGCAVIHAGKMAPLAIGSGLMAMVYMGGHISGAQYNPAVSLGVLIAGKQGIVQFLLFVVTQFAAACVATLTVDYLHPTEPPLVVSPGAGVDIRAALLAEALFTFALVLVVLNVACAKKTQGNSYYGLAIGFTVLAGAFCVGSLSGGAFNPAVGLAPNLLNGGLIPSMQSGHYETLLLYAGGPLAGGLLAGIVFRAQEAGE